MGLRTTVLFPSIHVCVKIDMDIILSEAKFLYNKLQRVCIETKLYAFNICICTYEKKIVISICVYHYPHYIIIMCTCEIPHKMCRWYIQANTHIHYHYKCMWNGAKHKVAIVLGWKENTNPHSATTTHAAKNLCCNRGKGTIPWHRPTLPVRLRMQLP